MARGCAGPPDGAGPFGAETFCPAPPGDLIPVDGPVIAGFACVAAGTAGLADMPLAGGTPLLEGIDVGVGG